MHRTHQFRLVHNPGSVFGKHSFAFSIGVIGQDERVAPLACGERMLWHLASDVDVKLVVKIVNNRCFSQDDTLCLVSCLASKTSPIDPKIRSEVDFRISQVVDVLRATVVQAQGMDVPTQTDVEVLSSGTATSGPGASRPLMAGRPRGRPEQVNPAARSRLLTPMAWPKPPMVKKPSTGPSSIGHRSDRGHQGQMGRRRNHRPDDIRHRRGHRCCS